MTSIYKNIVIFFALVLAFIIAAFFKSYFALFPDFEKTTTLVHLHVALLLIWFALLILQPILVIRKKLKLHRLLGRFSYFLLPLLVVSCILMTRQEQLRQQNLIVFAANIIDVTIFIALYLAAIFYKRISRWHGRLMMLTVLPFISPAAARLDLNGVAIELSLILIFLIVERFTTKVYRPYLIGLTVFVLLYVPFLLIPPEAIESVWQLFFDKKS